MGLGRVLIGVHASENLPLMSLEDLFRDVDDFCPYLSPGLDR